ncbi:MAG: type IX secretion system outer membrane channel protein PorV [Saprospiraceae bacterium]|nr:type IX secretion system outer membrane channel protein PorV [Saprospiraceae bacterium]
MRRTRTCTLIVALLGFLAMDLHGQCLESPQGSGNWILPDGSKCPNAIPTAVPFLRITPDARAGAMGDAGIAMSPDANSVHLNTAKLTNVDTDFSMSATYSPWLRNLGLNDVYLAYLSGFKKIDDLNSIGFSLRFFSLGDIQFTNDQGQPIGMGRPNEFEIALGYARKLGDNLSVGLNGKFIYSNLAGGQEVNGIPIEPGVAGAADLSILYQVPLQNSDLSIGLTLSNLGSKISYTSETNDFLPANFGLGAAWKFDLDEYNSLTFALDFNKLMVPTPEFPSQETYDEDENGVPDYRERNFFQGTFGSFSDAPQGFSEELQEWTISFGAEYWYDNQFAVRAGYFYENPQKGNRKYFTAGLGLKYNVFGINMSYLISTNQTAQQSNPLDKTLRFSLLFDFGALQDGASL